jgi:hypothetical protein
MATRNKLPYLSSPEGDALATLDNHVRRALMQLDRLRADIVGESGLSWEMFAFSEEIDAIERTLTEGQKR